MSHQQTAPRQSQFQGWADALSLVGHLHGLNVSADLVNQSFAWSRGLGLGDLLESAGRRIGLTIELVHRGPLALPSTLLPAVIEYKNGQCAVLLRIGADSATLIHPEVSRTVESTIPLEALAEATSGRIAVMSRADGGRDSRLGRFLTTYNPGWFWSIIFKRKVKHLEIAVASFIANLLALAGALFSMQVWDRVVPAQSLSTLWVLALGVMLAVFFEYLLRVARARLSDAIGKEADQTMSSMFFGRALDIRNDARPKSTGAFISQLREMEQVRELLASTTATAATDIPFAIIFLAVVWSIGGPLGLVVLAALPLIVIPGVLLQIPLMRLSKSATMEGALRHAVLVESIEGVEDIKALQAEARFQRLWDRYTDANSNASLKQRQYVSLYVYWIQSVQQLCYVGVIVAGTHLVLTNDLTTGAVIGCSMLATRAISPFAQFAQIFTRWQQAKTARSGLDDLMRKPLDHGIDRELLRRPVLLGDYSFNGAELKYDEDSPSVVRIDRLDVKAGEKIALVGRIGAGKSTLLKMFSGTLGATGGSVTLDGADMALLDPADIRRNIGYLSQSSRLFHGTLRENLTLGSPLATEKDLIGAMEVSGAIDLVRHQSRGLDLVLQEGGHGLSGGQRQTVMLARTLLRAPNIVVLDEPTASMDEQSERHFIQRMKSWLGARTLIVSTHRYQILELVDRVIVIDGGRVVMDGPTKTVLAALKTPPQQPPKSAGPTAPTLTIAKR